jgi:hypothetical protein
MSDTRQEVPPMYEIVLPDAIPEAVREYNLQAENLESVVLTACTTIETIVPAGSGSRQIEFYRDVMGASVPVREIRVVRTTRPVDWSDSGAEPSYEVYRWFRDPPEDREVEDLMNALGATAACVRVVQP